jgi:hypothetical protein
VLRWRPDRELVRPDQREVYDRFLKERAAETEESSVALLWVKDGKFLVPVEVQTGLTDGMQTEIIAGKLHEGDDIVSGVARPTVEQPPSSDTGSPIVKPLKQKKV